MLNKLKEMRETGSEEGFTLIELMIVVVIIGILAAIAIPIFANQQKSAIVAGVKSDVKNTNTNIATALVKAPTAASITGIATGSNGSGTLTGGATFDIVVSDSATTVAVGGAWNTYNVVGWNSSAFTGSAPANAAAAAAATSTTNGVVYQVSTGKSTTNGTN